MKRNGEFKLKEVLPGYFSWVVALAFFAPQLFNSEAGAADWPLFRNDSGRTGFTSEQAYPPLAPAWSFEVQGDVTAGPVVYGGVVYATARTGSVYALNAFTGELIWDYSSDDWIDASPAVSSAAVYAAGRDGRLYALDRLTGQVLWQAELSAPSASSPLFFNGRVYVGVGAPVRKLKAFDAATGTLLWEKQANQPLESAPSTDGRLVYYGSNSGRVYAVNAVTGLDIWPAPGYFQTIGSFGMNAVPVSGGSVYALPGHDERKMFRLLAADRSEAAVTRDFAELPGLASENEVTSPVVSPYGIFAGAGSRPHNIYAFDAASLEDLYFSSPTAGNVGSFGMLSSPAMANGVLYFGTVDARLIAISSSGAVLPGTITLSSSSYASPAVSNGFVYTGVLGGKILAYKASLITSISAPGRYDVLDGTVPVYGYIKNPALTAYTLEYGAGEAPSSWSLIISSPASSEISGGLLGQWDTASIANGLYTLRLTASESSPSGTLPQAKAVVRVNHVPQPPSGLSASDEPADSGNKLRLNWTASPSAWVTASRVYRGSSGGPLSYLAQVSTPALTYLDASAVTGSTYTYAVRSFDGYSESAASGQASAFSINNDPSSDSAAPSAPAGLSAAPGASGGTAALAWTAPGNDGIVGAAAGYEIRYATWSFAWASGSVWKSSRPAAGPYGTAEAETVSRLFGGVTYYFLLKAYDFNSNYSPASNAASSWATPDLVPPAAPSSFQVADKPGDHGGALVLGWLPSPDDGAGADDVYGYKIFRSESSGVQASSAPYAEVGPGYSVYTDTSAPENIKFYYAVAAFDSTNNSTTTAEAYGVSADNWRFLDKSNGGTVRLADGAEVNIPPDSASANDSILVTRLEQADYFGTSARVSADTGGARSTGIVYEVKFENPATKLLKAATLTLPYTTAEIGSIPEANLRVYLLDGARWSLVNTSRVLPDQHKVSAEVEHFSVYSVMGYVPSGALLAAGSVYTYPNPAKGDTLTFKFLPADTSFVIIDVYNVAGEKVARLEKAGCPGGVTSEITWIIKNIASGVYVYRVEALSALGKKSVTKKLAIIH